VAHVDVRTPVDIEALARRLGAILPSDVRVFAVTEVGAGFDARFSAIARRYCYRIADRPCSHDPLTRGQVLWLTRELDAEAMDAGARHLLGEHDFAAVSRRREGASTVRRIIEARVLRPAAGRIDLWIEADAFCHSMVRSIAGALVAVGLGRQPPTWIADILTRPERCGQAETLPAHALTLEKVRYPPPEDFAATATAHRTLRGPAFTRPA
jgi:tRNA pseudouridine38-40 synthase